MAKNTCTRCGNERSTTLIYRPQGMSWFTPSASDFTAQPPSVEYACGDCITDDELLRERGIGDVVLFATDVLMCQAREDQKASLELVSAFFQVRNNDTDVEQTKKRHRNAAVRAIGLETTTKNSDSEGNSI